MRPRILLPLGLLLVVAIVAYGYFGNARWTWEGTGFSGADLWDWLDLLIVPAALAFGVYWLNRAQSQREQETEDRRARDAALQSYLDQMTALLIDATLAKRLRDLEDKEGDNLRVLARARTLTTLGQLDPDRKRSLLQFLSEADMINRFNGPVVSLRWANLRGTDLRGIDLRMADLSSVDLSEAKIDGAGLLQADLSRAILRGVDLRETFLAGGTCLQGADLTGAKITKEQLEELEQLDAIEPLQDTIMPDGSRHD